MTVDIPLCKCGCGQPLVMNKTRRWRMRNGSDAGYLPYHRNVSGPDNGHWKGGRFTAANGYIYVLQPDHPNALKRGTPGYVAEHRLVMSDRIGRPLEANETVHHINGDKADNRPDNLVLMSRAEHAREHHAGAKSPRWRGGRKPIMCRTCGKTFLPTDRRNDPGAKYCGRQCFYKRPH